MQKPNEIEEIIKEIDTKFERMCILNRNFRSITWCLFEQETKRKILKLLRIYEGEERIKACYAFLYMLNRKELLQDSNMLGIAKRVKRKEGKRLKAFALGEKRPKKQLDVEHLILRNLGLDNFRVVNNGKSKRTIF